MGVDTNHRNHLWTHGVGKQEPLAPKKSRLTTLRENNEAENGEPQLQKKRGRLTTLRESNEAENGEPQLQKKRGIIFYERGF